MPGYRDVSYWFDSLVSAGMDDLDPRMALPGDFDVDVAIIGGGLTGLWSAYYLARQDPNIRIAILEKDIAGFGASGRNGGWCSALFPASTASLDRRHGFEAAIDMRQAMIDTVDEVGRVTDEEGIHCDFLKGGTVSLVRSTVQRIRAEAEVAESLFYGVDDLSWATLPGEGGRDYLFDPACASLHPGKLVRGLAEAVERMGVAIFEQTEVTEYSAGEVVTTRGTVRCETVVVAMEGYRATLQHTRREALPLYSLMIATEPLTDETWAEIGIGHGQTFADFRHLLIYGQRTADNRCAFGGRGARYHWGSSIRPTYDRVPRVFEHLKTALSELFPQTQDAAVTHRWGGPLGVHRDWHASVSFDERSRIAVAGGYVGDGLSTTNLAGRTIADLICGIDSELSRLPWVDHRSPHWEPEPLRFLGANLGLVAMDVADKEEAITGRPSLVARAMAPITGH